MSHDGKTELRVEVPVDDIRVLDGYCTATGKSRTDVMREMLAAWSFQRVHEATLICRVAGVNPFESEGGRK